jgi:hypothetical protein
VAVSGCQQPPLENPTPPEKLVCQSAVEHEVLAMLRRPYGLNRTAELADATFQKLL